MIAWLAANPDPETIRRKTAEVFERPEFGNDNGFLNLIKWIGSFFTWLGNLGSTAPIFYWALLISCCLLFILLLAYIFYVLYRATGYNRMTGSGVTRAERMRRSAAHFSEAGECANRGDYTEAIRHLFLALVFRFDEAGRVVLRPGATNREYLHLLDEGLPERNELSGFVDFLDDYWYGQRPTDRGQYERSLNVYQRLAR